MNDTRLLQDMIVKILGQTRVKVQFQDIDTETLKDILCDASFAALERIGEILRDPHRSDFQCIEGIIKVMEALGSDVGVRHDFG